jgi:hypothetical protein
MAERDKQIIRPIGGMNLDLARELIGNGQATFLKNCISTYNQNTAEGQSHNTGVLTPVISNANNAVIGDALPAGTNIVIGTHYDRRTNDVYYFVWNSGGEHTIWVYNAPNNAVSLILQEPLLNFSRTNPITSCDVVLADISTSSVNVQNLNRLLYWTDGYNEPYKINVDTIYSGTTFLRSPNQYFLQVKYPPLDINITSTLTNPDANYPLNWIREKMFQFRYSFVYDDGEQSVSGAISTLYYSTNNDFNFVELSMDAGSSLVTYVKLYYREGNFGDWKLYDTISRDLITANTDYPYDNITNIFKYKFFNNKEYQVVDQSDISRNFDLVPLKSFSQEFVEENVMLHGNILEGYDNLDLETINTPTIEVAYSEYESLTLEIELSIAWTSTVGTLPIELHKISNATGDDTVVFSDTITGADTNPYTATVSFPVDFGDEIYLTMNSLWSIDNGSFMVGTYSNIQTPLSCGDGDFSVTKTGGSQTGSGTVTFQTINFDTCDTWDASSSHDIVPHASDFAQLKQNGSYQFGFVCYDDALRSTAVQTSPQWLVDIKSIQENNGFFNHDITIDWNSVVLPDWVKYVKVVRTKNKNIDRSLGMGYIQFGINSVEFIEPDGTTIGVPGTDPIAYIRFTLANLADFNTANYNNTTTTYQFVPGDRIQIIANGDGVIYDTATYGILDFP